MTTKKATKKKRRIRSPHPGVVLLKRTLPSGRVGWQARYTDPDTGKLKKPMLDLTALSTHEARRQWAIKKSKALAKRRMDLEAGAPPIESKPIGEAVEAYFEAARHRLRDKTLVAYRLGANQLTAWAEREGVKTTADLTPARLGAFRNHLIAQPKRRARAGGKRGQRKAAKEKRSPSSVNRELRAVKTILTAWRVSGHLPHVTKDALGDTLKALPVPRQQPAYLTPGKLKKLLEAAERHDSATFAETREEHAGRGEKGSTPRHVPIAPFVAFVLLTGCRRGEALGLRWEDVDLTATDHTGREVGEIRLRAEATKTKHARTIGLEVSPGLRALLVKLRLLAPRGAKYVFGCDAPYTADLVEAARRRLLEEHGAPPFDWQTLRSTCATFLTNAPGIWGSATVFLSAQQLGHSVAVAEKHYLGVHRGIPRDARTLEAAMKVEEPLKALSTAAAGRPAVRLHRRPQRRRGARGAAA